MYNKYIFHLSVMRLIGQKKSDWGLGLKALDETLGDSSQTLYIIYTSFTSNVNSIFTFFWKAHHNTLSKHFDPNIPSPQ